MQKFKGKKQNSGVPRSSHARTRWMIKQKTKQATTGDPAARREKKTTCFWQLLFVQGTRCIRFRLHLLAFTLSMVTVASVGQSRTHAHMVAMWPHQWGSLVVVSRDSWQNYGDVCAWLYLFLVLWLEDVPFIGNCPLLNIILPVLLFWCSGPLYLA